MSIFIQATGCMHTYILRRLIVIESLKAMPNIENICLITTARKSCNDNFYNITLKLNNMEKVK